MKHTGHLELITAESVVGVSEKWTTIALGKHLVILFLHELIIVIKMKFVSQAQLLLNGWTDTDETLHSWNIQPKNVD